MIPQYCHSIQSNPRSKQRLAKTLLHWSFFFISLYWLSFLWFFLTKMNFILYFADPCKRHSIIDDFRRDPDYTVRGSQRRLCDNLLVPGWYRFQINGTDADMPTTCAQVRKSNELFTKLLWKAIRKIFTRVYNIFFEALVFCYIGYLLFSGYI